MFVCLFVGTFRRRTMTPRRFIDARGLLSEVVHRCRRGRPPDRVVASVSSGMSKEVTVQGRGVQDGTILPFSNKFQCSEGHGRRLATIFNGALGEKDGEPPRGPGRVSWVHTPPDVTPACPPLLRLKPWLVLLTQSREHHLLGHREPLRDTWDLLSLC